MNSSQENFKEYNYLVNNSEILKNEITLQAIAKSLDNITKTLGNFATKKDLEGFATKKDLEKFATKEDLKGFATKKDLETLTLTFMRFAAKTETSLAHLEDLIDSLAITTKTELFKMESRISERIDELDKKVDRNHTYSVNQLDYILTHYARRQEYVHFEGRLKKLERKVFA